MYRYLSPQPTATDDCGQTCGKYMSEYFYFLNFDNGDIYKLGPSV